MMLGQYQFKPNVYALLTLFLLCSVFIRLGLWQLERAIEVTQEVEGQKQSFDKQLIALSSDTVDPSSLLNQRVSLTGHFLVDDQILKDNVRRNSKIGYKVLTPFRVQNSQLTILVNQGWVQKTQSGLPDTTVPDTLMTITGVIKLFGITPYMIQKPEDSLSHNGKVWLYFDAALFEKLKQYPIAKFTLDQLPTDQYGFLRNEPIFKADTGKHYSYAIQWFGFTIFACIIFLYFNLKSIPRHDG